MELKLVNLQEFVVVSLGVDISSIFHIVTGYKVPDTTIYIAKLSELFVDCLEAAFGESLEVVTSRYDAHLSAGIVN